MNVELLLQKSIMYFEGIALLFSIVFFQKYSKSPAKLIPLYLLLVFGVELIGLNRAMDQWLYNLLGISELLIFTYIFYNAVNESYSRKIILGALISSIFFILIDLCFISHTIMTFLSYSFGFVSLGIAIMCVVYLFEMTNTEKVLYQNRTLLYWVVIGLLIFHLCNLPITILTNDLFEIGNVKNILIIQSVASVVMYSCYIIGFIWSKKEYNY